MAGPIGRQTGLVKRNPAWGFRSVFGNADQLIDRQSARAPIDHEPVELAHANVIAGKTARLLSDDDLGAVFFVGALEPAGDIHRVTDHRVVEPDLRADIADEHFARIYPDPNPKRAAAVIGQLGLAQRALARERGAAGIDGMVDISRRRPPER